MKKNGFTLIELLATIMILSLIMVVAVPNVMSTIENNKRRTYVEDAKKMITLAEYRIRSDTTISTPDTNKCIIVTLSALDFTEFDDGPEGGDYDLSNSYVVIANSGGTYKYYATLSEKYGSNKRKGVTNLSRDELNKQDALQKVSDMPSSISVPSGSLSLPGLTCTVQKTINYQKS